MLPRRVSLLRAFGVIGVAAVLTGRAHAQSDDGSAIAEQLHTQARNLATANQWPEACARFEDSLRYAAVLATRLELAACYEHIGKLAAAWRMYRESAVQAAQTGDGAQRDLSQSRAAAIEPRLARLVIAAPSPPPAGFTVTADGARLDAGKLGATTFFDAGRHEIIASAPGFAPTTRIVALVAGKLETLALPALVVAAVPAPAAAAAAQTPAAPPPVVAASDPPPSSTRKYVGAALGVAGLASAGVGLWFGRKASSSYDDAKALCGDKLACSAENYDRGKQLISDTRGSAAISTALIAAGGAAFVIGVVLVLTAPRAPEHAAALVPTANARGAGVALVGSF
jgi:hypothetical protein